MDGYAWVNEDELFSSFCMTWVQGLSREQVIERLPVTTRLGTIDFDQFEPSSWDHWDDDADGLLVGVTTVDDSSMLFEVNGYVGVTESILEPLSAGRRVVGKHFSDGNYHGWFNVFDDRIWTLGMDTAWVHEDELRDVSDEIAAAIRDSGLRVVIGDGEAAFDTSNEPAAFALFERLTGIAIRPDTFRTATFEAVTVRV